jgi:hypothetical protein
MLYSLHENQLTKSIIELYKSIEFRGNKRWMPGQPIDRNKLFGRRKMTRPCEVDRTTKDRREIDQG